MERLGTHEEAPRPGDDSLADQRTEFRTVGCRVPVAADLVKAEKAGVVPRVNILPAGVAQPDNKMRHGQNRIRCPLLLQPPEDIKNICHVP